MREAIRSVLLFPGQGAYRGDTLHSLDQRHLQVRKSFDEIDIVVTRLGGTPIIPQLFDRPAPSTDALISQAPDVLQLAIFGTSMALHNILAANGYQADVLLGHSFGEIAALVAGGAYSVAEGAELVVHRNNVLRAAAPGRMVALSCDVDRARGILDVLGDPWTSIATENGPRQTVVSGPTVAVDAAVAIAAALGIPAAWLPSPYAFHSSLLADLIGPLTERIRHLQARPLTTPVFSSTLGRFYRPDDQVPEQIARALVAPARFARSVAQLADAGASTFVECGGGAALTGLVRKVLPSVTATAGTEWLARLQTEPTKPTIRAASISTIPTAIPTPAHVISTARPAPLPPAVAQSAADPATREALFAELVAMYAEALEYPTEVFTESVSLEADLGIDSVKQTELLARAADRYGLPEAQPEGFRLSDLDTMGKVVNYLWSVHNGLAASTPDVSTPFVRSASSAGPATAQHPLTPVVAAPVLTAVAQSAADPATREALFAELVAMYAEALEYPTEVFTESVSLEADLGIDSVKQTELLARAADRYGLPEAQPEGFRLSDLDTMGKVVNYLWSMSTAVGSPVVTDVRAVAA